MTIQHMLKAYINEDIYEGDVLELLAEKGFCPAIINDDNGKWAMVAEGTQNVPVDESILFTTFFVEPQNRYDTVREAVVAFLEVLVKEEEIEQEAEARRASFDPKEYDR